MSFRRGGTYVLVGGLGEVGQALAEALVGLYQARIALIGRRPLEELGGALDRILRVTPESVHYEAADVADAGSLQSAIARIRARFGRIDGVMHMARSVVDGPLGAKSRDEVERVLAAKIAGTENLDRALAGDPPSWLVLFSSLASWAGLAGGADYAAACRYQDAFAEERATKAARGERGGRTLSVCWPQWTYDAFLDDAKRARLTDMGLAPLDAAEGLRALDRAITSGESSLAVLHGSNDGIDALIEGFAGPSSSDDAAFLEELRGLSPEERAAYLDYLGGEPEAAQAAEETQARPDAGQRVNGASHPLVNGKGLEETVADTFTEYLKVRPDRFTDCGLDSIKALHIADRLEKRLGLKVDPAMFIEHPTLAELSSALRARRDAGAGIAGGSP